LALAGEWKQHGMTAFNLFQAVTVSISVMVAVFVSFEIFIGWIFLFYLWNVVGIYRWHL
jgi:hypothetical protein